MARKKKEVASLGLYAPKKRVAVRASSGLATWTARGSGSTRPTPDQIPLMTPRSDWVRPEALPDLHFADEVAIDTENVDTGIQNGRGPGWAFKDGHVAGVGVAWRQGDEIHRIYAPVRHPDSDNFPPEQVGAWVDDLMQKKRVVFFNAGYDIGWLHADMGARIPPVIDDASCAAFLVDENRDDLSLDGVAEWRGVPGKDLAKLHEAAQAFGYKAKDARAIVGRLPARYAGEYGQQDPVSTLLVMEDLRPEMARQGLMAAYDVEMRLVPLMHAMRKRGVRIDIDRALLFQERLEARAQRAVDDLTEKLGFRVGLDDVRSHLWLVRVFDGQQVPYPRRGGKATFERDWMRMSKHWLPRLVAEARQCLDMAQKFVGNYLIDFATNGRIHATVNQWLYEEENDRGRGGTRSHRLSYSGPPLQQAPSRGERFDGWELTLENAIEYRACFLPEEGELWFSPDYSQQEYRHIVADAEKHGLDKADVAAQMYRDDPATDFHRLVVTLTGLPRGDAKNCNFAKSYGAGKDKFATMIGQPVEAAAAIMDTYDKELPFVKQLAIKCQNFADRKGYINMFDGARSHFDKWEVGWLKKEERERAYEYGYRIDACDLDEARERQKIDGHPWAGERLKRAFTHKAMNRRIQGGGARQIKLAMAQCWEAGLMPILQLHDELSFSLQANKEGKKQADNIVEIMRTAYTCSVPFLVDAEAGQTWGDAKHTWEEAIETASKAATAKNVKKKVCVSSKDGGTSVA